MRWPFQRFYLDWIFAETQEVIDQFPPLQVLRVSQQTVVKLCNFLHDCFLLFDTNDLDLKGRTEVVSDAKTKSSANIVQTNLEIKAKLNRACHFCLLVLPPEGSPFTLPPLNVQKQLEVPIVELNLVSFTQFFELHEIDEVPRRTLKRSVWLDHPLCHFPLGDIGSNDLGKGRKGGTSFEHSTIGVPCVFVFLVHDIILIRGDLASDFQNVKYLTRNQQKSPLSGSSIRI